MRSENKSDGNKWHNLELWQADNFLETAITKISIENTMLYHTSTIQIIWNQTFTGTAFVKCSDLLTQLP